MLKKLDSNLLFHLLLISSLNLTSFGEEYLSEKGAQVRLDNDDEHLSTNPKFINFTATENDGMNVVGEINLSLGQNYGLHEIHIHENGTYLTPSGYWDKNECNTVGPVFKKLGTVSLDRWGKSTIDIQGKDLVVEGEGSIIGKVLVLHRSGDRSEAAGVACGMIKAAEHPGWRLSTNSAISAKSSFNILIMLLMSVASKINLY